MRWAGPLAIVAAAIANLIVRAIARAVPPISSELLPLSSPGIVVVCTAVGVLGATIVFAIVGRGARRPVRLFLIIAAVALLLSLVPDLLLLSGALPSTSAAAVGVLMLMYVVAAGVAVGVLTRLAREPLASVPSGTPCVRG